MNAATDYVDPAVIDVAQSLRTVLAQIPFTEGRELRPRPGSRWHADTQVPLPASADPDTSAGMYRIVESAGFFRLAAGLDYMRGLESVLLSGSLYSTHPFGRVALEAFSYTAWLWAPGLIVEQRVIRGLLESQNAHTREITLCKGLLRGRKAMPSNTVRLIEEIQATCDHKLQHVNTDLATMRQLVAVKYGASEASGQQHPSATSLVRTTLDNAVRSPHAGVAAYGVLSSVTHSSPLYLSNLLTVALPDQNTGVDLQTISVFDYLSPVYYAVVGMAHCLHRITDCWGLDPLHDRMQPAIETLEQAMLHSGQNPLDIDVAD